MNFTKEQIQKAMECKTADELLALAKSEGIELTREEAEEYIAKMKTAELTDEELKEVAGGMPIYCYYNCPDFTCTTKFCPPVDDTCTFCGHCRNYTDNCTYCPQVD